MPARIEFAASIAALVLDFFALLALLLGPVVPYCRDSGSGMASCRSVAYTSLLRTGLDPAAWLFILGMFALILIAAGGGIAESQMHIAAGGIPLLAAGGLSTLGCLIASTGLGMFYLPALLAIGLAGYGSVLARVRKSRGMPETSSSLECDSQNVR